MTASWIEAANRPGCEFPLDNLPWCRFENGRLGVGIGDLVLEIDEYDRAVLTSQLRHDATQRPPERAFHRMSDVRFELPFAVRDYTDFYASVHHATNVGKLFRPDNPLMANYTHLPVAYHGRASSVVVSGAPVRRPWGQLGEGRFGPTEALDYELELGIWIGAGNELGTPVPVGSAREKIAGFCIVNDWSARDIQRWEYQPLGPFLGKSFATSVSPWVVVPGAVSSAPAADRPGTLPYLRPAGTLFDITMEVYVNGELRGRSNTRHLYWTVEQMIAHHTSNGCNLRRGDLLASGTVSGPDPDAHGCLLETGGPFLRNGDEVAMRAYSGHDPRIGFGECRGIIVE
jgi:fumarylacetoacetase